MTFCTCTAHWHWVYIVRVLKIFTVSAWMWPGSLCLSLTPLLNTGHTLSFSTDIWSDQWSKYSFEDFSLPVHPTHYGHRLLHSNVRPALLNSSVGEHLQTLPQLSVMLWSGAALPFPGREHRPGLLLQASPWLGSSQLNNKDVDQPVPLNAVPGNTPATLVNYYRDSDYLPTVTSQELQDVLSYMASSLNVLQ